MNNTVELTRKERERNRRRQEILEAAAKIFADKGFEKTTLNEIAAAAEFGKGTLYLYFSNKEDIFVSIFEEGKRVLHKRMQENLQGISDAGKKIERFIELAFQFMREHESKFRLFMSEMSHSSRFEDKFGGRLKKLINEDLQEIARLLETGMQQNKFKNLPPMQTALALKALIHSQVCAHCLDQDIDFQQAEDIVKTFFLHGLLK